LVNDIGTRVVMAMGGAASSYEAALATTASPVPLARGGGGLRRRSRHKADPLGARLHGAGILGITAWRRDHRSHRKSFVFGRHAGAQCVTAALLVKSGWNGVDDIFSAGPISSPPNAPKAQPIA